MVAMGVALLGLVLAIGASTGSPLEAILTLVFGLLGGFLRVHRRRL